MIRAKDGVVKKDDGDGGSGGGSEAVKSAAARKFKLNVVEGRRCLVKRWVEGFCPDFSLSRHRPTDLGGTFCLHHQQGNAEIPLSISTCLYLFAFGIHRSDGKLEPQTPLSCSRCDTQIAYQTTPAPVGSGQFIYVLKGAVTEV